MRFKILRLSSLLFIGFLLSGTLLRAGQLQAQAPADSTTADAAGEKAAAVSPDDKRPSTPDERLLLTFESRLQDEDGAPISGVFPLRFKLYRSSNAAESIWSEQHHVAVIDGKYTVALGKLTSLKDSHIRGNRWIGVELIDEGEILRDRLILERHTQFAAVREGASPDAGAKPSGAGSRVAFADIAERAVQAERAQVADTADAIGEMTAEDVERLANQALRRLGEHIADPNAHQASSGASVGSRRQTTNSAGGRGGKSFSLDCPPGHVVTGIEGKAGRVVDSIRVVCSPLQ